MSVSEQLGESREVTLRQGTIRYRERGSGTTLVLLHGVLVNGDLWRKVVPELADRFRCVTPDLPLGSHELPLEDDADLSPPGLADLIADFVAAVAPDGATLVGNDTAGAVLQILATRRPEAAERLVLTSCDCYDRFFPPVFRYLQLQPRLPGGMYLLARAQRLRALDRLPIAFGWATKRPVDRAARDSYAGRGAEVAGVRRDTGKVLRGVSKRHTLAAAERLGGFDKPVLVVWASEDRLFPLDYGRRLASAFPNARFATVDDSYTFIPEDQPERLAEAIAEFAREPGQKRAAAN